MKTRAPQSATSLRRAPGDDAHARMKKYFIMMSIRVICFVLMVVITPYGWYTGVFAVGAILLPYLAVVVANVSSDGDEADAVPPERALTAAPASAPSAPAAPTVLRIRESPIPAPTDADGPDPTRAGSADRTPDTTPPAAS